MTIESSLERIATALEILSGQREPQPYQGPAKDRDAPDESPSEARDVEKKSARAKAKPARKTAEKAATMPTGPTKDDVREALKAAQRATSPAAAKGILSSHNANTLSELKLEDYVEVINEANNLVAVAEEGE